jgi:hypothetical protein
MLSVPDPTAAKDGPSVPAGLTAGGPVMTARTSTRTDFTTLDEQITRALTTLRLARTRSAREKTTNDVYAEKRAEANLNTLLDYRHAAQQR